jgi:hypothetical protein
MNIESARALLLELREAQAKKLGMPADLDSQITESEYQQIAKVLRLERDEAVRAIEEDSNRQKGLALRKCQDTLKALDNLFREMGSTHRRFR